MAKTILDSFRELETRFYFVLALFVVAVLLIVLLYYAYSKNVNTYIFTSSDYQQLLAKYNTSVTQLTKITGLYNTLTANLSTPVMKLLYTSYTVNIPKRNVSAAVTNTTMVGPVMKTNTTSSVTYYTYGFSFNATNPGYLLLNATSTAVNMPTNVTWEFLVSNKNIIPNQTMTYYNYQSGSGPNAYSIVITNKGTYRTNFDQNSPRTIYAPTPTQQGTVSIPVGMGQVYVWIANFNNQSISVTFSAKYFGQKTH